MKQLILAGGALMALSVGAAQAGPCDPPQVKEVGADLCPGRDHRNRQMKHRYHFGSPNYPLLKEVAQLSALVSNLDRVVRVSTAILRPRRSAQGSYPLNATYPILARMMTARRNNLKETIGALERKAILQTVKAG